MVDIAYAAGEPVGGWGILSMLLPFILIFIVFYFLLIQPQRRKEREHKQMLESLKKGDKVVTTGGICGVVTLIKENKAKVEIAQGVEIEVIKDAIANRMK